MHEELIARLGEVGLTRNEALAYVTLLEDGDEGGITGYEVAARSGVPRSAVYAILRRLEAAGAAFPVGQDPARYLPVPPERFVEHRRREQATHLDQLAESLRRLPPRAAPEPIWVLGRYDEVMARAEQMIRAAQSAVYLSLWARELAALLPALRSLDGRKLHRVLHGPDAIPELPPGFHAWIDDLAAAPGKTGWSHKLLVVVDHREALIGGAEPEADNQAVWTRNPSLVDVATNHIILDITLLSQRTGRPCGDAVSPMIRPHLPRR